ncbi:glycosyltransferase [Azospirillum brasilense]|uniref:glycosyltransferase family protein n=1 Tax=Azospirillum brasilense TaxID=192 RepID=UPI000E68BC71|nr:glycosyltransferase [Azospirillum brasilense]NUB24896.1 glycosyltransferase [Azospirillum brasilense]NUB30498.1 glycosyltransferase [Azospirillum brasilense]RIW02487.1 glycosyltransferase family 1 protein [Azospirillum brasilense]
MYDRFSLGYFLTAAEFAGATVCGAAQSAIPGFAGYYLDTLPDGEIRKLAETNIVLNCHLDAAGPYANNLRLYEATGVGSFLLTDWKPNLHSPFEIGTEVAAYRDAGDAVRLIRQYEEYSEECRTIAEAGQRQTSHLRASGRETDRYAWSSIPRSAMTGRRWPAAIPNVP